MPTLAEVASTNPESEVQAAVATFSGAVSPRLQAGVGEPEDQLRGPFESLITSVGAAFGISIEKHGETLLKHLLTKPDYAIDADGLLCGYVELKAPGSERMYMDFVGVTDNSGNVSALCQISRTPMEMNGRSTATGSVSGRLSAS